MSSTKTERRQLRQKQTEKRAIAKLTSKQGVPQVHPQTNFYDMLTETQLKALKPFIAEQVKQLGQAIARNVIQLTASYNLRINVLETLAKKNKWVENDETLRDLYTDEEDKALGLVKSTETAVAGDYVRFTAIEANKEKAQPQFLSCEKLANQPYEANEAVELAIVGMLTGQKKLVETTMPNGITATFEITVNRISKHLPKAE